MHIEKHVVIDCKITELSKALEKLGFSADVEFFDSKYVARYDKITDERIKDMALRIKVAVNFDVEPLR